MSNTNVYCFRYLGDVYLSENAELADRFTFLSPHIENVVVRDTSANQLADCLLRCSGKDHLLFVPHNVG